MINSRNRDIKDYIFQNGLTCWEVAERLGMADSSFSRILRYKLTDERKNQIYKAINDLSQERG